MNAGARRAIGAAAILIYLPLYVVLAVSLGARLTAAPWFVQLVFYAAAGVLWVFPLRPLFAWMGRGATNSTS